MAEYELHRGFAGIDIFCQAKSWAKLFKNNVACEVRKASSKERFKLKSDSSTFIPIPANSRCEIRVGVVQMGFNTLSHIAKTECMLQEGEVQIFIYTPPVTSLSKSVLTKGEIHRVDTFVDDDRVFEPPVSPFGHAIHQPSLDVCYQCHKPLQNLSEGVYAGANMMASLKQVPYPCKSCGTHFCVNCTAKIKKENNSICPFCGKSIGW